MKALGSRSTSVGQLQKYAARTKLFVCFYTLTRLQIIQISVENQCEKKARGNPLRILHSSITTISCESIAHPKFFIRE